MLHAWNDGMNSLRLHKTWSLAALQGTFDEAGWADVDRPKPAAREKIGRSPLLGRR